LRGIADELAMGEDILATGLTTLFGYSGTPLLFGCPFGKWDSSMT
jgi:hypothetical protein